MFGAFFIYGFWIMFGVAGLNAMYRNVKILLAKQKKK